MVTDNREYFLITLSFITIFWVIERIIMLNTLMLNTNNF